MTTPSVLLVDDAVAATAFLYDTLRQQPLEVTLARSVAEADDLLASGGFAALVAHLEPDTASEHFFRDTLRAGAVPLVVIARQPSVAEAIALTRAGAAAYLEAPVAADALLSTLAGLTGGRAHREETSEAGYANIIGASAKMRQVFSLIERVCDADTTVLVRGESGTGKELIAQALHYQGDRCNGPFVPVNCGAIPGELLESELFGHEKGAFTHAIRTRVGRFELADGGTVFLDEISEMSPMLQVKILRVLQERRFERIGGTKTISSDFRVIAATNRDLEEEVRKGTFREDLYYRLNVIPIESPPLRTREDDIVLLVRHFIDKFTGSKRKHITGITPEALARLKRYPGRATSGA